MTQKVDSLREILLRKTRYDEDLNTLIRFMDKEVLAEYALESLEKMAMNNMLGQNQNSAFRDSAQEFGSKDAAMLHDALSHHGTRLRAALKAGDKEAAKHHADKFITTMDTATRLQSHTQPGKLKVDFVDFKPWDQNAWEKIKPGASGTKRNDYSTQSKGFHTRANAEKRLKAMLMGPHWSYGADHHKSENKQLYDKYKDQSYPIHEIKVNGKYLDIDDTHQHQPGNIESHEFDDHFLHAPHTKEGKARKNLVNTPNHKLTPEQLQAVHDMYKEFHGEGGHKKRWTEKYKQKMQENPEFANRGLEQSPGGLHDILHDSEHPETGENVPGAWSKMGFDHDHTWDEHPEHGHKGLLKPREQKAQKEQAVESPVEQSAEAQEGGGLSLPQFDPEFMEMVANDPEDFKDMMSEEEINHIIQAHKQGQGG